jgi:hypothetical protein
MTTPRQKPPKLGDGEKGKNARFLLRGPPVQSQNRSCVEWEFDDNPISVFLWVNGTQIDQFDHVDCHSVKVTPRQVKGQRRGAQMGSFSSVTEPYPRESHVFFEIYPAAYFTPILSDSCHGVGCAVGHGRLQSLCRLGA